MNLLIIYFMTPLFYYMMHVIN